MKTVYLVKAQLDDHEEFLCAVFSKTDLADTYVKKSKQVDGGQRATYRVEKWLMDAQVQ